MKKIFLGAFFIGAGIFHFLKPETYLKAMPSYVPFPLLMIYASGACEIGLGVGVLIPKISRLAGWGLIALLVAVFPANLHMAFHPELFPEIPFWLLWIRLPLQGILIFWVYGIAGTKAR
jgi:uncharacterized membrane protein